MMMICLGVLWLGVKRGAVCHGVLKQEEVACNTKKLHATTLICNAIRTGDVFAIIASHLSFRPPTKHKDFECNNTILHAITSFCIATTSYCMQQLVIACVSVRLLPSHLRTPSPPPSPHPHSPPTPHPHTGTPTPLLIPPSPASLSPHTYTHNPFKPTHKHNKKQTHTHTLATHSATHNTQCSTHTSNTPHTHRRYATQPPSSLPLSSYPTLLLHHHHPIRNTTTPPSTPVTPHFLPSTSSPPTFHPPSPLPTDTIRATDDQLHVLVVDVVKWLDTVDFSILDCALGRLGLFKWFRRVSVFFFLCSG